MLDRELIKYKGIIEEHLDESFQIIDSKQKIILEAMKYSLMAGGKRIRPILFLKTIESAGKKPSKIDLDFAMAIEMIHTYSLVHDDLPAMDDDDLRRGKPTNHKIYGEDIAILAGDGLLNLAFETMTECAVKADTDIRDRYIKAMKVVGNASGIYGMIGGQVVDIKSESGDMDKETLDFIHKNKTSKLIEASLISGAIIGGAEKTQIDYIRNYGENIGMLFQIRDDILDRIGDTESLGKTTGIDDRNDKLTYVSLYGLERAIEISQEIAEEAKHCLEKLDFNTGFFDEFVEYMISREK